MNISQTPQSICFRKSTTKNSSVKWLTSSHWWLRCSWLETLLWLVSSKTRIPIWRWCVSPWEHSHFSPAVTDSVSAKSLTPTWWDSPTEISIVSVAGRRGTSCSHVKQSCPSLLNPSLFPLKPPGEAGLVTSSPNRGNLTDALGYCDIIRTIHLVFVPGSWHRTPKSLVIS